MGKKPPSAGPEGLAGQKRAANNQPLAISARTDNFQQQRVNIHAARHIPVQTAEAALKDGELDLQAFLAAHEFEIRSLEQSMATSKTVSSTRAFQKVPRGLRRRTASHNPKRVPRRLRERAKREMAQDNTPLVQRRRRTPRTTRARLRAETAKRLGILAARQKRRKQKAAANSTSSDGIQETKPRPKIRRNELNPPPQPPSKFRRRQINKTWLPTHLWHAKRARMTVPNNPLWRFAIPLTSSEKIYRPTHRAQGERGTVVWDMSYMSTIGLYGNSKGIQRVLQRIGLDNENCWNDRGRRWRLGTRCWTGLLSRDVKGVKRTICPAQVVYNPEQQSDHQESKSTAVDTRKLQRQVFLRIHPAAFLETFNELLRLIKMETPKLYIEDLRFEIGSIELTGPASTETLLSVLTPYLRGRTTPERHAEVFRSLNGLTNPASLPNNATLSFSIQDPRLRYPLRKLEHSETEESQMKLMKLLAEWPAEELLQQSALFNRNARYRAACLPSQKSINRRKGKATGGAYLKPILADPPIPIMLLANRSGSSPQAQGTWTLLLPWKCVLPVWYSIVHCPLVSGGNPRFAGLNEARQVAFERCLPWFPGDFITTNAGVVWELDQRKQRHKDWEKRPKSKRTEWGSLQLGGGRKGEIGDGLACDFELLFKLHRASSMPVVEARDEAETDNKMDWTTTTSSSSSKAAAAAAATPLSPLLPLQKLNEMSKSTFRDLVSTPSKPISPSNAVLTVRISFLARGVAASCARIYRLPNHSSHIPVSSNAEVPATFPPQGHTNSTPLPHDLRKQWLDRIPSRTSSTGKVNRSQIKHGLLDMSARQQLLAKELIAPPIPYPSPLPNLENINGEHPLVPNSEDLIGFVTSGSFSLADGRGAAIGALVAAPAIVDVRESRSEGNLCIVRNAGENVGWIARWEVI